MPLPALDTPEWESICEFMRADLECNMGLTRMIDIVKKRCKEEGRDFYAEAEKFNKKRKGGDVNDCRPE